MKKRTNIPNGKPYIDKVVTVSITMSKRITLNTDRYIERKDGTITFDGIDLKSIVEEQVILPQDAYNYVPGLSVVQNDLSNWVVDDFEVVEE